MKEFIKKFNNHNAYTAFTQTADFVKPNVSLCVNENEVHYSPFIETRVICTYNVTTTEEPTLLLYGDDGDCSRPDVDIYEIFSGMEVDGVEQELDQYYQFNTTGEHIVKYTLNDDIIDLSGIFYIVQDLTSIIIPSSIVTIGESVFYDCSDLTSVTIPNTVTSIGQDTFSGCSGLTSVTIPNSVTKIGGSAFSGCSGLTSVTIPNSVTTIGEGAFRDCSGLTSVTIPNSVTYIGSDAFYGCSGLTEVNISDSVTSIGAGTFAHCSSLTSINIPNSVTSINSYTFYECTGLTSVIIPNLVTNIGDYAFSGCTNLSSVIVPNSVTSVGAHAFDGTPWYNNQPDGLIYVGKVAYKYKGTMPENTSIIIEEGTVGIAGEAFEQCSGLISINIPNSVTNIGRNAFARSGLTSINIPNSVTTISSCLLYVCSNLRQVILGNNISNIENNVFINDRKLTKVTITSTIPPILGDDVFTNTHANLHIYVPSGSVELYKTQWPSYKSKITAIS